VERDLLAHQLTTGFGCVPTSSMGRLFDAVASLTGVRQTIDYEAEAAIALECLAGDAPLVQLDRTSSAATDPTHPENPEYRFDLRPGATDEPIVADPGPVIREIASDVLAGVPAPRIARGFHDSVTTLIVDLAQACREQTGLALVALGGGVFQNALLVEAAEAALSNNGFTVLLPRALPAGDGGIALGQILVGASA
jgi:hydrogenase maturation protein HypF